MDLWSYLKSSHKPIVLYGTGNGADRVMDRLAAENVGVSGVFASSGFVRNRFFRGMKVESYAEICDRLSSFIVVMCFGSAREEVFENVKKISSEREFYIADVPVSGNDIFDEEFYLKNKHRLGAVREKLCDEQSRNIFDNIVSFKLSGKPDFLFSAVSPENIYDDIVFCDNAPFILDLGAYTGDTVKEFSSCCPGYSGIIAVEPNKNSFKKLLSVSESLRSVCAVNAVISDKNGDAFLTAGNRGRGARQDAIGEKIKSVTVDSLLAGEKAHVIKFDVEGNELPALCGASETIKNHKPKLILSCYHKSGDLFLLPEKVFELNGAYKMLLRRKNSIPAWDAEYIFV
ncbi:MAG: FkbM family methyltransferase [Clostridia bacterium]|nr:FkbM family methyltransferase [Clostridia bacterium]